MAIIKQRSELSTNNEELGFNFYKEVICHGCGKMHPIPQCYKKKDTNDYYCLHCFGIIKLKNNGYKYKNRLGKGVNNCP